MDKTLAPVCVVMGDLVKSETARPAEAIHDLFNRVVDQANARHGARLASPLTITLGDEFQGLAWQLSQAVPIVRDLRLALMRQDVECRFVIGQIQLQSPLNPDRAWNMMGQGLSKARSKLNEKNATTLYRFSFLDDPLAETLADALGAGLTLIERAWTKRQRDDIDSLDSGVTAAELAERRGVSVHSIYKVRAAGNHDAYSLQWAAIQRLLTTYDQPLETL